MGIEHSEILSRAQAAFLGLAVGDALGAPVEFMTHHEIAAKYGRLVEMAGGGWLRLKPGAITDDTQMSLCVARAIVTGGGWSLTAIADNFAGWLKSKPVDVGDTCRRGIRNYMLKGQLETPFNQWDAGNGSVMRMVPTALFSLGDTPHLERCAVAQARLTHNHPLSDAACIAFGKMIQLAVLGASKTRLRREYDSLLETSPVFSIDHYQGLATGYVVDTMQTVFHHFFRSSGFEDCLVGTVNQGGDADTTGAIAGALAGGYYGLEQIPKRWLKKMERGLLGEIERLSRELVRLSGIDRLPCPPFPTKNPPIKSTG